MDTIKVDKKGVQMIAHRGLSGIEKENTCSAFVAAANRSYFGIETDIHPTTDGELVVLHDDNVTRVSNGALDTGVETSAWADLQGIVLPDRDGTTNRIDLRLPRLVDYIRICKRYGKTGIVEIKGVFSRENLEKAVALIKDEDYLDHVIFIAFDLENCVILRELLPQQPIQWLTGKLDDEIMAQLVKYRLGLDIYYPALNADNIRACHDKGIEVNCWTVDNPEDAANLIAWGVDYITSNILE